MPTNAVPASTARDDVASLEAGLDALESPISVEPRYSVKKVLKTLIPPLSAILLLFIVWTAAYAARLQPSYLLPSPLAVWQSFQEALSDGIVFQVVLNSLRRAFIGFGIALAIGTGLGLLLANFLFVRRAIGPLVTGLQTLPSVAWVPPAILWFGLTTEAMVFVVILGATPSIANGLVSGIDQIPTLYHKVGRVLGARGANSIRFIILPASLPGYISGLRQGWAFAWRSLMAAELIAFSPALGIGLGQFLNQGRELTDMPRVMLAIIMILIVGIAIELCFFAPIERRVLRQRGLLGAKG